MFAVHTPSGFTAGRNKRQACRMFQNSYVSLETMSLCTMNRQCALALNQPQEIADAVNKVKMIIPTEGWRRVVNSQLLYDVH